MSVLGRSTANCVNEVKAQTNIVVTGLRQSREAIFFFYQSNNNPAGAKLVFSRSRGAAGRLKPRAAEMCFLGLRRGNTQAEPNQPAAGGTDDVPHLMFLKLKSVADLSSGSLLQ